MRCGDCRTLLHGSFQANRRYPDLKLCEACVLARGEQPNDITGWCGWDTIGEVPAVLPILMGTYCICACVIMLVLLLRCR